MPRSPGSPYVFAKNTFCEILARCLMIQTPHSLRANTVKTRQAELIGSIGCSCRRNFQRLRRQVCKAPAMTARLPSPFLTGTKSRLGFRTPDNPIPIPRPSRSYGRRRSATVDERFLPREDRCDAERRSSTAPPLAPTAPDLFPAKIDKSLLTIAEPKRRRDKAHLRFVASQPCLVCGRPPGPPTLITYVSPRPEQWE